MLKLCGERVVSNPASSITLSSAKAPIVGPLLAYNNTPDGIGTVGLVPSWMAKVLLPFPNDFVPRPRFVLILTKLFVKSP